MKAVIKKTNDWNYRVVKDFSSLQELLDFRQNCGHCIIIDANDNKGYPISDIVKWYGVTSDVAKAISESDFQIEIYNSWRE